MQQTKQLPANANVYSCARTLEMGGLVTLARTKFISRAQKPFSAAALLEAARPIFDKQNPVTWDFEHKFSASVANISPNADLVRLLMKHGHLA
jgi:hypothetical protein